jgi:hypothetical protein
MSRRISWISMMDEQGFLWKNMRETTRTFLCMDEQEIYHIFLLMEELEITAEDEHFVNG